MMQFLHVQQIAAMDSLIQHKGFVLCGEPIQIALVNVLNIFIRSRIVVTFQCGKHPVRRKERHLRIIGNMRDAVV